MRADQIWQAALGELQLQMTKATFDTWVKNTHIVSQEDGTFIIGVHNAFTKDWLENRLLTTIKRTLVGIVGRSVEVKFAIWAKESSESDEAGTGKCSRGTGEPRQTELAIPNGIWGSTFQFKVGAVGVTAFSIKRIRVFYWHFEVP